MRQTFTHRAIVLLLLFSASSTTVVGQILSYTNAPNGSLDLVANNVTGTGLVHVNGAQTVNSS